VSCSAAAIAEGVLGELRSSSCRRKSEGELRSSDYRLRRVLRASKQWISPKACWVSCEVAAVAEGVWVSCAAATGAEGVLNKLQSNGYSRRRVGRAAKHQLSPKE
jgi:hypothetical protein